MPRLDQPAARWRDAVRRIEDLGFATVSISDHLTRGWVMEPVVAMTAAAAGPPSAAGAEPGPRQRLPPPGAGPQGYGDPRRLRWAGSRSASVPDGAQRLPGGGHRPLPAVRIERLEESVEVLKGLSRPAPLDLRRRALPASAASTDSPSRSAAAPALLVGGGGRRRVLGVGRPPRRHRQVPEPARRVGDRGGAQGRDRRADRDQKVAWVRGRHPPAAARTCSSPVACSSPGGRRARPPHGVGSAGALTRLLEESWPPAGSVASSVEALQERRREFGK